MANAIISANAPELNVINGLPVVSSLAIAENFEKQHFQVMRDIRALSDDIPNVLRESNFVSSQYEGKTPTGGTRKYPMYLLTRDGFTLVAMGFTGKKALAWKIKYIQAFNEMERALLEGKHGEPVTLPHGDTLTATEQAQLQAIVQAKAGMVPADMQRKAFAEMWTRFNPPLPHCPVCTVAARKDGRGCGVSRGHGGQGGGGCVAFCKAGTCRIAHTGPPARPIPKGYGYGPQTGSQED